MLHSEAMEELTWVLGGESVTELYEYKNLGVVKNYIGSFSNNADDNIDKTQKKLASYFSRTLSQPFNLCKVLASSMPLHFTVWYLPFCFYAYTFSLS